MSKVRQILVKPNQTIWDVALNEFGSIEGVFEILKANDSLESLNEDLSVGQELKIVNVVLNDTVLEYYKSKNIASASQFNLPQLLQEDGEELLLEDGQDILL